MGEILPQGEEGEGRTFQAKEFVRDLDSNVQKSRGQCEVQCGEVHNENNRRGIWENEQEWHWRDPSILIQEV